MGRVSKLISSIKSLAAGGARGDVYRSPGSGGEPMRTPPAIELAPDGTNPMKPYENSAVTRAVSELKGSLKAREGQADE